MIGQLPFPKPIFGTLPQTLSAIALGLAGFALNFLVLDLGWGLQFLMGSALALLCLRILPPGCTVLSVGIAACATLFHWQHPWALAIWLVEGTLLAAFTRRASPILVDFLFWLLLGGPLLYATYGGILGFQWTSVLLVIAKQALNGLLNIWIAELLFVLLLMIAPLARRLQLEAMPASHFAMMALSSLALVPLPFHLWIGAAGDERLLVGTQSSELESEVSLLQRRINAWFEVRAFGLQILAADAIATGNPTMSSQALGPLQQDFDSIVVRDAQGRILASYRSDAYAGPDLVKEVRLDVGPGQWTVRTPFTDQSGTVGHFVVLAGTADGKFEVLGTMPRSGLVKAFGTYRPVSGTALAILNPRGITAAAVGDSARIGAVLKMLGSTQRTDLFSRPELLTPSGFGKSLMHHMTSSSLVYQSSLGVAEGWRIVAARDLGGVVRAARQTQLDTLALHWIFLSLSIVAAAIASRYVANRLKSLEGLLARIVNSPSRPEADHQAAPIRELNDIREKAGQLGGTLSNERSELATYQERLQALEAHAPIVIYGVAIENGQKSALRFVSGSVSRVLGYSQEEISVPGWWAHNMHPEDAVETLQKFGSLQDGQTLTGEYRFRRKDGVYRWLYDLLVVTGSTSGDGKLSGVGFIIDVTVRKQAQQQVIQATKLASLGEMATGMAHELNQPLNVIKLTASSLSGRLRAGGTAPDEAARQLSTMVQQVDRAARLITHLRAFGRTPDQAVSNFDVAGAIEGARSLVAAALATDRIDLELEILTEGAFARGQATLLEQVIVNLILNARDSIKQRQSREPGLKGLIVLTLQKLPDSRLSIVVDDNGAGIPASSMEHLFEPFFTTKPVGKGTGLGLSVSYGIIKSMNGTIEASSIGMGARFVIILPEAAAATSAVA